MKLEKCICKVDYDVIEDFGMNFQISKIYSYDIFIQPNKIIYMLYEKNLRLSSGYSSLSFNKKGFDTYFIDVKELRKLKLEEIDKRNS